MLYHTGTGVGGKVSFYGELFWKKIIKNMEGEEALRPLILWLMSLADVNLGAKCLVPSPPMSMRFPGSHNICFKCADYFFEKKIGWVIMPAHVVATSGR